MDVESECSVRESVEDNDETRTISAWEKLGSVVNETKVYKNGSCLVENNDNNGFLEGMEGKKIEVNSPPLEVTSQVPPSPVMIKGNGLRKWRRIKRDGNKGGDNIVDTRKILTESLSIPGANSSKRMQFSEEMKQKSEGSVSSTNAVEGNLNGFLLLGDSGLVIGPTLFAGMDSENSGDQSSKSSTAASAPNSRYEVSNVAGLPQDKFRTSLGGKNLSNSVQRDQQRKGRIDTSKKARGDKVKIEKENSRSSVESDSRSSNFAFMQGAYSVISNGMLNGSSIDYDGENGDDPLWEVKEERSENHGSAADQDPLVESIFALQSAQEALGKEVQKFGEIGKEDFHVDDSTQDLPSECTSIDPKLYQTNSAKQLQSGVNAQNVKEAKGSEPETILNSRSLEESMEKRDVEAALEDLFMRKIEAEVEYFIISRMIHKLKVVVDGQSLLEEQKTMASEQAQMLNRLGDAENKFATLNKEAENLENYCEDIVSADETTKLQKRVWKYTACFFVQLVILIIIMGLFILQTNYTGVVPT
ncbi:WPP domain-interacting protein 1 [Forsythia ovata]|uniref:WPP domain-interacting protein 1 n=1 Tax=Forsythia ovata TaxID=205694 RepID=A0ABD1QAB9_9LAMI